MRPAQKAQRRFSLRPLPADVYAELAVLRATAEATTYQVICAGIMALSRVSPEAVRTIVETYAPRKGQRS